MPQEPGEVALRAVLKHLGVMTTHEVARLFVGAKATSTAPLSQGGEELQVALRDVVAREAHAAAVARLACNSREARRLAAAALPAPARAARHAKMKALIDTVAAARAASLLDEEGVEAALNELCAAEAAPPGAAGDEVAAWRACADAAFESLHAMPDAEIASFTLFVGAAAGLLPGQDAPALEDPAEVERMCRKSRAERFVAALTGSGPAQRQYDDSDDSSEDRD